MKTKNINKTFLIFFGLVIFSFALFAVAQENAASDKSIFEDNDQDGLSNEEEIVYGTKVDNSDSDGDGYSDGAEVKGGYNPLLPAPGDRIISSSEEKVLGVDTESNSVIKKETEASPAESAKTNLTEEVSAKVSELVKENMAEGKETSSDEISQIAEEFTNQNVSFEDLPAIDSEEIIIKEQNYSKLTDEERKAKEKEDSLEYLTSVAYILANNSPKKISATGDLDSMAEEFMVQFSSFTTDFANSQYLEDLSQRGDAALAQIKKVEVPENLVDLHTRGLQLAKYGASLEDNFFTADPAVDPLGSLVQVNKTREVLMMSNDLLEEVNSEFLKQGIDMIPIEL